MKVTNDPTATLVTYALGSCIGVVAYDPTRKVGGMLHYMLPLSRTSPDKAKENPAMFGDTGIPALFKKMYELGSSKKDMVVKVAGGATFMGDDKLFNIGKRNYAVLRKLFWKNGVIIAAEEVGGTRSRTVRLHLADGRVVISGGGEENEL